ncbi:MAG: SAM-dependent methyltransferase, partial [Planctomycetota bacterium]
MGLWSDLKILYHMAFKPVRGGSHAERLESFYGGQAKGYDDFRKRLLKGREELWKALPKPEGGVWVDMGGGTGANLENFGD